VRGSQLPVTPQMQEICGSDAHMNEASRGM
jgi:hypothetical protein